jgi:HrpA-like RNA helicase
MHDLFKPKAKGGSAKQNTASGDARNHEDSTPTVTIPNRVSLTATLSAAQTFNAQHAINTQVATKNKEKGNKGNKGNNNSTVLPADHYREVILNRIATDRVTIIHGETGYVLHLFLFHH